MKHFYFIKTKKKKIKKLKKQLKKYFQRQLYFQINFIKIRINQMLIIIIL